MKQINFKMRNTAIVFACLAVTMFSSCNPIEPSNPNNPADNAPAYYDPEDDALDVALRNVKIKFSVQMIDNDPYDDDCDEIVQSEAMACKGRLYVKTVHWADNYCDEGYNNYEIVVFTPPNIKYYSLDDNEWFGHNYADYYNNPKISGSLDVQGSKAIQQYYRDDRLNDYWDSPDIYSIGGYTETTWKEEEATRTIAGIQCTGYSIHKRQQSGTTDIQEIMHKVWYDPATNITMRYEEYHTGVYDNHLDYWFQINEIEFGKVKPSDIDALLNDYLSTHSPTDISDDDEPGSGW
jgi:hypothetical protein